ncbi:hypothetical protein D3C80_1739000 [compost metagenome]
MGVGLEEECIARLELDGFSIIRRERALTTDNVAVLGACHLTAELPRAALPETCNCVVAFQRHVFGCTGHRDGLSNRLPDRSLGGKCALVMQTDADD